MRHTMVAEAIRVLGVLGALRGFGDKLCRLTLAVLLCGFWGP